MSKGTIRIGESVVVQETPKAIASMNKFENKQRLVGVTRKITVHPGDSFKLTVPNNFPKNAEIMISPNLAEAPEFFEPKLTKVEEGMFEITNESSKFLTLKKNCKPVNIQATVNDIKHPIANIAVPHKAELTLKEILEKVSLDGTKKLSKNQTQPFIDSITRHSKIFQND